MQGSCASPSGGLWLEQVDPRRRRMLVDGSDRVLCRRFAVNSREGNVFMAVFEFKAAGARDGDAFARHPLAERA